MSSKATSSYPADCYALVLSRDPELIDQVRSIFAPDSTEACFAYHVPYLSDDPQLQFADARLLFAHLAAHPKEPNAVYWRNNDEQSEIRGFGVNHTSDGAMVFSVHCAGENAPGLLDELMVACESDCGYFSFESPPPTTVHEFRRMALADDR